MTDNNVSTSTVEQLDRLKNAIHDLGLSVVASLSPAMQRVRAAVDNLMEAIFTQMDNDPEFADKIKENTPSIYEAWLDRNGGE